MQRIKQTTEQAIKGLKLLMLAATLSLTAGAQAADGGVKVKGEVITFGHHLGYAMVIVELDNKECIYAPLGPNGKFNITIPEGRDAILRFDKPGYTAKEVVVRTDHADEIKKFRKDRTVKFDVHLRAQPPDNQMEYAAPVGFIRFLKGGLMKVNYEYQLRPVEYHDLSLRR